MMLFLPPAIAAEMIVIVVTTTKTLSLYRTGFNPLGRPALSQLLLQNGQVHLKFSR